ncbi:MAG TPA: hypothetical protein VEP50_04975 [bacterium]|nr:hypothetical protein [bacterium]
MTPRAAFWELAAAGVALGGTGVWALAAAARTGTLRLLLEMFPRASWDAVTWGLIPALLLVPCVVQGFALAWLGGRRIRTAGVATFASVLGTLVALAVFGLAILDGVRRLPPRTVAIVTRTAPNVLIPAFAVVLVAGWLLIAARLVRRRALGAAALPLAIAAVAVVWWRAHGQFVALSYVLDRPEANGFFAAVAIGGAAGAAWAARRAGASPVDTRRKAA